MMKFKENDNLLINKCENNEFEIIQSMNIKYEFKKMKNAECTRHHC